MKHFISVEDLSAEEYLRVCDRARAYQEAGDKGGSFAHVCPGKVLATMFFQESTRTSSALQSAIIRLGGGYVGVSGTTGTYVEPGHEGLMDFLRSFASFCDIMAVRHKELDLDEIADEWEVPLINAMCGRREHSLAGLRIVYSLVRRYGDLRGLELGVYGMIASSRPTKAMLKALSLFGVTIHEDSILDEFGTPPEIRAFLEANGAHLVREELPRFLGEVDCLIVVEGLPQGEEPPELIAEYNRRFRPITSSEVRRLKPTAVMMYNMPRQLTDGRLTVASELDGDPQVLQKTLMKELTYVTMALMTHLLGM